MKNSLKTPVLAVLAIIPVALVVTVSRFIFSYVALPFGSISVDLGAFVFVALHIGLIAVGIWLAHREKLPFYFLFSLILGILLSISQWSMN